MYLLTNSSVKGGSHQQPVGTDVLKSEVVVLLNVVEVAIDKKTIVGELVIVYDVLLVHLVDHVGVFKIDEVEVVQIDQSEHLGSCGRIAHALEVFNITSDFGASDVCSVCIEVIDDLFISEIHFVAVNQVVGASLVLVLCG